MPDTTLSWQVVSGRRVRVIFFFNSADLVALYSLGAGRSPKYSWRMKLEIFEN